MQYLYDDVIPPFRFFTKIVMRCVNNALDEATASHRTDHAGLFAPHTTIAMDNPCLVEIAPGLVTRGPAVSSKPDGSVGKADASAENNISAVCVAGDVMLCGFTDGRTTLIYSSPHGGPFETIEIPPFTPNSTQVVALSCVPLREGHWAVSVSYKTSVFVRLVSLKQSAHLPMVLRKRSQQRVIELLTSEWPSCDYVSSLQLSPCLKYLAVAFSNDALVIVAALPPLEVSRHNMGGGPERVALDATCRVIKEGRPGGNCQARVFFMPERPPGGVRSAFLPGLTLNDPDTTASPHHPLCLLVWVNGNSYTRCSLKSVSNGVTRRLKTILAPEPSTTVTNSKKTPFAATAVGAGAGTAAASAAQRTKLKSKVGAGGLKEIPPDVASVAAAGLVKQPPFLGMYRGLLSDKVVAATLASSDGSAVVVGCAGGRVYLMDGYGVTSMVFTTLFQVQPMWLTALYPTTDVRCGMVLQAMKAPLGDGVGVMLAYARGSLSPAFVNLETVCCLRNVEGLNMVLPLRELPLVLLFCTHGTYLWDVHYNCVVASLTGLPSLEPFSLCSVSHRGAASGALRLAAARKLPKTLYLPFCTETAIVWWTSGKTLARLLIADLLAQVYPLLDPEFRGLPMRAMAYLLVHVPPAQRNASEYVANVKLPTEHQQLMDTYEWGSPAAGGGGGGGGGKDTGVGFANPKFPMDEVLLHRFSHLSCAPLHPETMAACFLETTCSTVNTRAEELRSMFGATPPHRS
ncbi:hypothetical protein TraAM80_03755 [Trypanosoma rangeli]|uniref:Uncharacterized protein n=1 Tax=Trypanosoma rangeli TaxID=5698 RepID=A0A422NMK2_TRYRA|nr:uncharacterized protein TraAM80_03755 [Trypanosoma rangeli]RNF06732.1 hypothetical protein TraAM80_03755 [Trypanosoma rangeli]|eukprot:RNF06732.1 hypothetical protein TraAM80_03755 [Trypanosoma rangeli]